MSEPHAHLLQFLPEPQVGSVESVEPISLGLSGAGVYSVTTSRGSYVLRVQSREIDEGYFAQQLLVLRRAAEAGIAPALVHVDEAARAAVSVRVQGLPVAAALGDPAQRGLVLASVVDRLRTLRRLAALLCGLTFLSRAEDLTLRLAPALGDAPSLLDCYEGLRSGQLAVQSPVFQVSMGLALLALGVGEEGA